MPKGFEGFQKGHKWFGNEETKKKISNTLKGHRPWSKGKKHSKVTKEKMSKSHMGKYFGNKELISGKNNYLWKGEKASYHSKHHWLMSHFGKANKCENRDCVFKNPKRFEWANVSKKYKRDKNDFIQLCPSCHRKWDMGIIEIRQN